METVLMGRSLPQARFTVRNAWLLALAGLAALYVPTCIDLARGAWRDDAYAHGPIVLAVSAWLAWRRRAALFDAASRPAPLAGTALLVAGLLAYLLGRTQSLAIFEVASLLPVLAGVVLALSGWRALRRLAFPVAFLAFAIPLPGFVLEGVTAPLKALVSAAVQSLLGIFGYAVEREGVVLLVEDHAMLVADACSGLNSLYSLFALGLLYTQLTGRASAARTALLMAAIVPIAIVANILRVLLLALVTVHLGEEAALGPVHAAAGMVLFVAAFAMMVAVDAALRRLTRSEATQPGAEDTGRPQAGGRGARLGVALGLLALMAGTAAASPALRPRPAAGAAPDLEAMVPARFGSWRVDPAMMPLPPAPDVQANLDRIYRQVVSRTYVNAAGERMMLTVAHGGDQSDALKAHRQEVCYEAQGFRIAALEQGRVAAAGRDIPVTRMHAVRGERSEPVTYWFTIGDRVVLGRLERLEAQVRNGLAGRVPDGMLVRVSSLSDDPAGAYAAQQSFIGSFLAALPAADATRLAGAAAR